MIFIDPVIEKASEERTVHKNIRIEKNYFQLGTNNAVNALSVDGLRIEENEIHYSEKNQELYALKDCRNVQIRENKENLTLR